MRAWIVMVALSAVVLSGCASNSGDEPSQEVPPAPPVGALDVPDGAELITSAGDKVLQWANASLPFQQDFDLPEGATMVRFVADPGADAAVGVAMRNDETGRRRCNQQSVVGFGQSLLGARSCSSLAAIDPPGTTWSVSASGSGVADVRIEFLNDAPTGLAAHLDLSQLSHATYELEPTQGFYVESFDGTQLWVEVTLPDGEGPWPTVIAASPYNGQLGRIGGGEGSPEGTPAMWTYWTQDWAKRGYAAINVDVRGFGKSGGCVEVWGENEQRDQKFIVDWVAQQEWSDGNVGFYGQSYVGTTPVAAAVQAPEALKAIIAVAPVIDAYHDWHYGGVPNGESSLSPVAYQALTDAPTGWPGAAQSDPVAFATDLPSLLQYTASGLCDPTLVPLANDPRAIHGDYYDERDFGARAGDVEAAVLYTQGFEDANVKGAMIPDWFNDIQAPKLGVFGHWLHQHPARMDAEVMFLGWMDQYVKGKDIGFENGPDAVITLDDLHRDADAWPPADVEVAEFGFRLDEATMASGEGAGAADLQLNAGAAEAASAGIPVGDAMAESVTLRMPVEADTPIVAPTVAVAGSLDGENGFVYAALYEDSDAGSRLVTYGMLNLALRNDYDTYEPLAPTTRFTAEVPLRPTEVVAKEGSTLRLVIRGVQAGEALGTAQPQPAVLHLDGEGSALRLPMVPLSAYTSRPVTTVP